MGVPATNEPLSSDIGVVFAESELNALLNVLADVKAGDFAARMPLGWAGVTGKVADWLNEIIAANQALESELARISRVVGQQGELSERALLSAPVQSWAGTVSSLNDLIDSLVRPTSEMQRVIGAVADGDLSYKVSADVHGDMLDLKNTINAMVDQLNSFAGEVTRVAREVGVEGALGGQAKSNEIGGVWADLTDNVNQLAANLTTQVRAISEVATAVTEGDLTRQVSVEAAGEVAVMKDKLNEMIRNLRETTRQNIEQDWLKTNRERFTRMLQGQRDLATVSSMILSELAPLVSAQHAVFYVVTSPTDGTEPVLQLEAGYGFEERRNLSTSFRFGEGLVGQCAKEKTRILLTDVPGDYVRINSGLGASSPLNIMVLPVLFEGSVRAVIELASFTPFSLTHQAFLDQLPESIGLVLNTIEADTVTANLLEQSQSQAQELRSQQEELRESNDDLEGQTQLLAQQNEEVESSKRLLEERAGQLAVSSKYKSEFIANMSHELRTPLNSLLILAEQLEDNVGDTMTDVQVEYASVIRTSGNDLLTLLNSILDLAKAESGTMTAEKTPMSVADLAAGLARDFQGVAESKNLSLAVEVDDSCPAQIVTDPLRLRQMLNNLLSNAFKFTDAGDVKVRIGPALQGWSSNESLSSAAAVVAFAVSDSGIGVDEAIQERIFEAFAQGDGSTARLYGGTGLGLSISRELALILGGAVEVQSTPGRGSTFTIYLPVAPAEVPASEGPAFPAPTLEVPLAAVGASSQETVIEAAVPAVLRSDRRRTYAVEASAFGGARVFVVDDDFRNVFAMKALLERGDAVVSFAESGLEAVEMLKKGPDVDIVLMDIMMPGMDGYATIRAIRKLDGCEDLPIIAVTGKVMAGERQRCLDAGANDYVPKPVDTAELVSAISPWLPVLVAAVQPWRPTSVPSDG